LIFAGIFLVSTTSAFVLEQTGPAKVKLDLYYESLCPYCRHFITTQLGPNFAKFGKYMDIGLNPYGNAHMTKDPFKEGQYNFRCQHGEGECRGGMMEACLMDKMHKSPVPVIWCIEALEASNPAVVQRCMQQNQISVPSFDEVKTCAFGPEGKALFAKLGQETPRHNGVPYVLFNGVYNAELYNEAYHDLAGMLCKHFLKGVPECQ